MSSSDFTVHDVLASALSSDRGVDCQNHCHDCCGIHRQIHSPLSDGLRAQEEGVQSGMEESARCGCANRKMKDGRTHLAHKAEHAMDLFSGAVVAVTLQATDLIAAPCSTYWATTR